MRTPVVKRPTLPQSGWCHWFSAAGQAERRPPLAPCAGGMALGWRTAGAASNPSGGARVAVTTRAETARGRRDARAPALDPRPALGQGAQAWPPFARACQGRGRGSPQGLANAGARGHLWDTARASGGACPVNAWPCPWWVSTRARAGGRGAEAHHRRGGRRRRQRGPGGSAGGHGGQSAAPHAGARRSPAPCAARRACGRWGAWPGGGWSAPRRGAAGRHDPAARERLRPAAAHGGRGTPRGAASAVGPRGDRLPHRGPGGLPRGRTPMGPPCGADSVPQHEGLAPSRGRLQIPEGLFPRSAPSADGCIVDGGDRPRGEVPCAHQPGQLPSVTPVGVDPVARLFGHQGGGDDPADRAWFQQGAREPGAAGARFRDEDERRTLRLQLP